MSEQQYPAWWFEGVKALQWLEEQRDITDRYFSLFAISTGSKVSLQTVRLSVQEGQLMLEEKGGKWRFNRMWRIQQTLNEMVENGLMVQVSPGQYTFTKAGELYAQTLLMTNPEAAAFYKSLVKKGGQS